MKTYYIEKRDKHIFPIHKIKIEQDNCKIYLNLEKGKNIRKVINKLINNEATNVVLSKELCQNRDLINALNANNIEVFDGRWLEKYISFEILDYVIEQKDLKK